jgi:hypothetical protein
MGLFDFFLNEDKKIQRHIRRLTNRDAQPEDRDASARWLAENGSEAARLGLLQRFDLALEHHMKDTAEKDTHYALLVSIGQPMVEPTKRWLRTCKTFAMPLKLLEALAGRDAAIEAVFDMLDVEYVHGEFKPEKKRDLLIWLADVRDGRIVGKVARFLEDFDEGARYAAAEAIGVQDGEEGRAPMFAALTNPREESNRLRVRLAEIFVNRRWAVPADVRLPSGFVVREGRVARQ